MPPPKPPKPAANNAAPWWTQGVGGNQNADVGVNGVPFRPAPAAGPAGPATGGPLLTNTTDVQPDMRWAVDEMKKRYAGDMGAGRAIDVAGGKIREAGIGVERARGGDVARRGVSGTGAEFNLRKGDADNVLNDISGAATGIASDAEGRRDGMLGSILGGGNAMGGLAQGDRALALRSWEANEQNQRAREQAALARQMALLGLLNQSA